MRQRQSKLRRILGSRAMLLLNMIILFLVVFSFGREYVRNYEIDKEINALEEQALGLEAQNQEIAGLVGKLHTQDYLEEEARIKLGLKKPGEQVVVIPEPESGTVVPEAQRVAAAAESDKELSNPSLWWLYFLGANYD